MYSGRLEERQYTNFYREDEIGSFKLLTPQEIISALEDKLDFQQISKTLTRRKDNYNFSHSKSIQTTANLLDLKSGFLNRFHGVFCTLNFPPEMSPLMDNIHEYFIENGLEPNPTRREHLKIAYVSKEFLEAGWNVTKMQCEEYQRLQQS